MGAIRGENNNYKTVTVNSRVEDSNFVSSDFKIVYQTIGMRLLLELNKKRGTLFNKNYPRPYSIFLKILYLLDAFSWVLFSNMY